MHVDPSLLPVVIGPVALILADAVLGVGVALRTNSFQWHKLPGLVDNVVAPLMVGVGGTLIEGLATGGLADGISAALVAALATVIPQTVIDIKNKVSALINPASAAPAVLMPEEAAG